MLPLTLALILADLGAAIPFGLDSGGHNNHVAVLEWVLSAVFLLAALVLSLHVFGRFRRDWAIEAYAVSVGAWTASSVYAGFGIAHWTVRARLGVGLIFLGLAVAALAGYVTERAR